MIALDQQIVEAFTEINVKREYVFYKTIKTDLFTADCVKIQMGVDGVDFQNFERNLDKFAYSICNRIRNGRYFFSPFLEVAVSKDPSLDRAEAIAANKFRCISIATIKDVIMQRLLYRELEPIVEERFREIPIVSYAYRRGLSAPTAVRKIHEYVTNDEYLYVLDADLSKFFDTIPHDKLFCSIEDFFGAGNVLTLKLIRRFYSADRVLWDEHPKELKDYKVLKPKRTVRKENGIRQGIPQGGVLSGMLANIYMHSFDKWVIDTLASSFDIKYVRYADDFVVLFKEKGQEQEVFNRIKDKLLEMGLIIHNIGEKTKFIDLSLEKKERLEFVGFEVIPGRIRVREANIQKFKNRINEILDKTTIKSESPYRSIQHLIKLISFKILGNESFGKICPQCERPYPRRSWMSYFLSVTDVRQLRNLDFWIRKSIYQKLFYSSDIRLTRRQLRSYELPSLEKVYYKYKKLLSRETDQECCSCKGSISC